MVWYKRLQNLFRSDRVSQQEIDREMSFHLAERVDELVGSGMTQKEAFRMARRQLGNYSLQNESPRNRSVLTWIDSVVSDTRYAIRALASSPAFASVAILSLGLGIGANTAIFSLIDAVMLKYLPVSHPEQLLQLTHGNTPSFTNPIWEQLRDRQDAFSGIFAYGTNRFNLSTGVEARYAAGDWVSGDFFSTLGVGSVIGRPITVDDDKRGGPAVAVLSYGFWQKEYGGNPAILSQTISLDGHPFQIIGVTAPGFFGVDVGQSAEVFVPISCEPIIRGKASFLDHRSAWWLRVIGRPQPGVSTEQVRADLNTRAPDIFAATLPKNWRAEDQQRYLQRTFNTESAANGLSNLRRQYGPALITLLVVCGVVLLIACANVANLLLARAAVREREIAVRVALGSGRGRLIRQLLTESILLSLFGAVIGMLFAQWGSRLLVRFLSSSSNRVFLDLTIDHRVLAFATAVAVATGLLFGLAPAWRLARIQPHAAMKSRGAAQGNSRINLGKILVTIQVALSLVLVTGAGLLLGSFRNLTSLDPGFERDHVLLVSLDLRNGNYPDENRATAYAGLLGRLRALPGVRQASSSLITPVAQIMWNDEIAVDGYTASSRDDATVFFNRVSPGYFETLHTPILAGRDFNSHDDTGSGQVAIINQTMARKFFSGANPLGAHFRLNERDTPGPPIEIVGVVKDAKYQSLREDTLPTAYVPAAQDEKPGPFTNFELLAAGPPSALIPAVKATIEEVNRDVTVNFKTLEQQVSESLGLERLLATLSGFFGGLALVLAMIGLYGVMSYNVARRRSEIGIRMALGAERGRLLRMVLGEVGLLLAIGLVVGLGGAFASARLVSSFLYGLKPTDLATFALSAGILAAVAGIAGYLPARRASRLDPMAALREE
jgi:putative ABC transport system permease protein